MKISVLIVSYKSLEKLYDCINSIGDNREILIIENSNIIEIKQEIEKKYKNCKVFINNENIGYASAANLGFKYIKSKFVLLINPDIKIKEQQIIDMENIILELNGDFALASPNSNDLIDFRNNNRIDKFFDKFSKLSDFNKKFTRTDIVKGCSILVNLNKFENHMIFDENYFFFFEEIDLCRSVLESKKDIYIFNHIFIEHLSAKSVNEDLMENYHNFRHWNFFWGRFYYFKKYYGFYFSFIVHLSKLIRFGFNTIRYCFFSKKKFYENKYRFLGLFHSMLGKKSKLSKQILEKKI